MHRREPEIDSKEEFFMTEESRTGLSNEVYDLASVLYHALQGAQTYDKYMQDAGSNQALAQFFRNAKQQDEQRAQEALRLLDQYIQH